MENFGQRTQPYANLTIGDTQLTIGLYGCLITALAYILKTTPDVVNQRLKSVGGFSGAQVIWDKIPAAFPGVSCKRVWIYNNTDVLANVPNVVVEVPAAPIGGSGSHWVNYIGNHQLKDPWTDTIRPTSDFPGPTGYAVISGTWNQPSATIVKYNPQDIIHPATVIPVGSAPGKESLSYGHVGPDAPARIISNAPLAFNGVPYYNISQAAIGGGTGWVNARDVDNAPVYVEPVITSYTRNITITITAGPGVNVRDSSHLSGNVVRKLPTGAVVAVDGFTNGDDVAGNSLWYKTKNEQSFFWSGATNIPSPTVTPDPAPSAPPPVQAAVQAAPASPQVEQTPAPAPQITPEVVTPVVDNSVDNPVMPPVISGQSVEDLAAKNQQLAERNKELVNASLEKDKTIELQSAQLTKVNKTVENMKQDLGNIGMYKKANEVMSGQVEAYKLKIGEYKSNLETAYQDAFAGWKLVETSPGIKGLFTLLPTTIKLFFSLVTALSHSHVIAIKKDAKILSSLPEEITSQGKTAS